MNLTFLFRLFSWKTATPTDSETLDVAGISQNETVSTFNSTASDFANDWSLTHDNHRHLGQIYDSLRDKELALIFQFERLSRNLLTINDHLRYINRHGHPMPSPGPTPLLFSICSLITRPPTTAEVVETLKAQKFKIKMQYRFHLPSLRKVTMQRREAERRVRRDLAAMEALGAEVLYEEWVRVQGMVGEEIEYVVEEGGEGFRRMYWE